MKKNGLTAAPWVDNNMIEWFSEYNGRLRTEPFYMDAKLEMRPNLPFEATLICKDYRKGRSSMKVVFTVKETGGRVAMFFKTFWEMLNERPKDFPEFKGKWWIRKTGQNYGIEPYSEEEK